MTHRKDNYLSNNMSSRFQSRPRSLGQYGSSPSVLSSLLGGSYLSSPNSYSKSSYSPSSYRNYSPYTSSFGRPGSSSGIYGGTSSGYGGVYLPSTTLSSLNLMSPTLRNYEKKANAHLKKYKSKESLLPSKSSTSSQTTPATPTENKSERKSRAPSRSYSFNKERSQSVGAPRSGLSSRSTSLSSLVSEGYCTDSGEANEKRVSREQLENAAPIENGNLDYKALWEASQAEVKRLRDIVKSNEQQLRDARSTIERVTHVNQNSLTELEKREKRAMERKLSEMEEELKQLQKLKAENERLRAENRALTRVVSKLTNSAGK